MNIAKFLVLFQLIESINICIAVNSRIWVLYDIIILWYIQGFFNATKLFSTDNVNIWKLGK